MTILLQTKVSPIFTPSKVDYPFAHLRAPYHEPTDDVLTCDDICYTPRPLCLAILKRVAAARAISPSKPSMQIWLRMARAVLGDSVEHTENIPVPSKTNNESNAHSFEWSSPEDAALIMTGKDHPSLSLPDAVCVPLSRTESSGRFHQLWVEETLGFITEQAAGCRFEPCVAVPRSETPAIRLNQISAVTGLGLSREWLG
ncbi:hypothetical protein BO71DRAFT_488747 [Aspergillus ellipticus CBS 707.79]|uniref:Uncharacterized protein n=1 Tax=Aspergillus ellipticus CBS 707.79 TaxID=1448320 RepID=A0A319CT33_9EURO|nr:hypothetical protein BO71DRAFT_488747 [Aspergillus ellipticus CBS 707.79]